MTFKTVADMPKQPKYGVGETMTMKRANLYGEKVGVITKVNRLYKRICKHTGGFDPDGLVTSEDTISSICIPYEFDGETLIVDYGDKSQFVKGKETSKFYGYTYTIKSAKMLSEYSESGITRNKPKPEQVGNFYIVENTDGNNGAFNTVAQGGPEVYVTDREGVVVFKDNRHEAELWIHERHGITPLTCPTCKGSKKVTMTFHPGKGKAPEKSEVGCVTCHGTGRVTPAYAKAFQKVWGKENWCSCKKSSGSTHTRKGGQDYYNCNDCGKTTQIG